MHLLQYEVTNLVNQWHREYCLTSTTNSFPAFHHYLSYYLSTLLFHHYFTTHPFHEADEPLCQCHQELYLSP